MAVRMYVDLDIAEMSAFLGVSIEDAQFVLSADADYAEWCAMTRIQREVTAFKTFGFGRLTDEASILISRYGKDHYAGSSSQHAEELLTAQGVDVGALLDAKHTPLKVWWG